MQEWNTNNNGFKTILIIIDFNRKSILKKILNIVQFIVDIFITFEKN